MVVAAIVLAGVVMVAMLRVAYRRELEVGQDRATLVSYLLQEIAERNLQAVDVVLNEVVNAARALEPAENDENFRETLKSRLKQLPHVRALFIVGTDGFVAHDTDYPSTPRVTLADRDYFKQHKADPDRGLHIGSPLMSRSVGRWFVSVSRRVDRPDGTFAGVAVAAVEPAYYDKLYGELGLDTTDTVALLHTNGTLIARVPESMGPVGTNYSSLPLFSEHLRTAPRGTFISSEVVGQKRLISYRSVSGYPLVTMTALSWNTLMANWWTMTYVAVASYALFAALALAITLVLARRRLEREEARRRALVTQKLQMVGQMTGGIAHDFRNLIAVVGAGLQLLDKNAADPEKVRSYAAMARDAVDKGSGLLGQLLTFAKHQELELKLADVNELLSRLAPILKQAAGARVTVAFDLMSNPPPVRVDHGQFDAAILNLVINARDAMLPEGGRIDISTARWAGPGDSYSTLRPGPYVSVCVRDNGPGIPKEDLDRVFEPFFTTKGDSGTGLGLSQVYGLMQQIGGVANVSSQPGAGTSVELLFPCAGGVEATAAPLASERPGTRWPLILRRLARSVSRAGGNHRPADACRSRGGDQPGPEPMAESPGDAPR